MTSPSSRKRSGVNWMYASGEVICRALQKLRTARRDCWPTAVPIAPMDAPITPAGMWWKEFCPHGREAQSIAFFSAPGMERLYSGVTKSTASEREMASLSAVASGGELVSWSGLYNGRLPIGISVNCRSGGASRIKARDRIRLIEVEDRLPTK